MLPRRTFAIATAAAVAAATILAGCQPGTAPAAPGAAQNSDAPDNALASLAGEYRVADIDGREISGGIGVALSVSDTEMWFEPRCAGYAWNYTLSGTDLTANRAGDPAAPTCDIAVHPEEQRLAAALDAVDQASRTPSNGIALTGGGHSVTLYSQ